MFSHFTLWNITNILILYPKSVILASGIFCMIQECYIFRLLLLVLCLPVHLQFLAFISYPLDYYLREFFQVMLKLKSFIKDFILLFLITWRKTVKSRTILYKNIYLNFLYCPQNFNLGQKAVFGLSYSSTFLRGIFFLYT